MITLKNIKLGQTQVEVCIESTPTEEEIKNHLTKIYDVVNSIARKAEQRGVDTKNWFYTDKEIKLMKESSDYKFI